MPGLVENGNPVDGAESEGEVIAARFETPDSESNNDRPFSEPREESAEIVTRANREEESDSVMSSERSGFSGEFFTQAVVSNNDMDHFDTEDEYNDTSVTSSDSRGTPHRPQIGKRGEVI